MAGTAPSAACCGCCFIVTWIIKFILTLMFLIGLALLFFWIIVNPHKMNIKVNEASLTRFNFTGSNDTLYYDLDFDIIFRNPNRIMGFYYDDLTVQVYYQGNNWVDGQYEVFYQGHKNTKVMRYNLVGKQEPFFLDSNERSRFIKQFEQDKRIGVFPIDVKIEQFRVRVKLGRIRIGIFQPKVHCDTIKVPLSDHGKGVLSNSSVRFSGPVNCGVKFDALSIIEPLD